MSEAVRVMVMVRIRVLVMVRVRVIVRVRVGSVWGTSSSTVDLDRVVALAMALDPRGGRPLADAPGWIVLRAAALERIGWDYPCKKLFTPLHSYFTISCIVKKNTHIVWAYRFLKEQ